MFLRFLLVACLWPVASAVAAENLKTIMVLGDSLSTPYRMDIEEGWVTLLERRLQAQEYPYLVRNVSVTGRTTGGALAHLDALLREGQPAVTVVELGANDGLRGLSLTRMRANLVTIVRRLRAAGSEVLLLPMRLPPNYGKAFRRRFEAVYEAVVRDSGAHLGSFLLAGFAADQASFLADGLHPTAAVQGRILENVWPELEALLR